MRPERIWQWSIACHRAGHPHLARVLKTINYMVFRCVLPYECEVGPNVELWHRGLCVVVHPNTHIGRDVVIGHGVTIGSGSNEPGSPLRVTIEDGVWIGAGAVVTPRWGRAMTLGAKAHIGANVTVTDDVEPGAAVRTARTYVRLPGEKAPSHVA